MAVSKTWMSLLRTSAYMRVFHMFRSVSSFYMESQTNKEAEEENVPTFAGTNGCRLYKKYWKPQEPETPRALVFVSHGFAEHSEWYDSIAQPLVEKGIFVAAHDHVGHGRSEGQRAQVHDFEQYVDDVLLHVDMILGQYPDLPAFVLGHSMGGAIALRSILKRPQLFKGMVTIGPLVTPNPDAISRWKITIGKVMASIFPSLPVEKLDSNAICRDPQVVKKYNADPLVYHGGVRTKWGMCVLTALEDLQRRLADVAVPMLTIQGDSDKLCEKSGAELLHRLSPSTDKKLSIYAGAFHQVHNEPDGVGEKAIREITTWITERL